MYKNLLIIGNVWPEPNSTAAGRRMLQLIETFKENNYIITFVSAASKTENSLPLENLNIQTFEIQLNNSSFDLLLKEIYPDMVLFDRFLTEEQFGWRVAECCPNALRILDTEDLHFLRNARHQAFKNKEPIGLKYLVNDITKREIASIYRCDLSLIISKYEIELLTETFNINATLLLYLPFLLKNIRRSILHSYPSFSQRSHFMTIGNFKHEPNWIAVKYLKNRIWPLIRSKLPNVELHIYGAYTPEKALQLNNKKEGFIIKGRATSLEEVFTKARICLAPLQFGAGLKGKLIDAMLFGTPSVTTKIGAEAMHGDLPWNGFITEGFKEFAKKSVELYNMEQDWQDAQQNGVQIINACYDKEKYGKMLMNSILDIELNIEEHRLKNFTGAMLMHHTLQSTKYLSKWISEKNR